jgi:hypothetical protein
MVRIELFITKAIHIINVDNNHLMINLNNLTHFIFDLVFIIIQ